MGASLPRGVNGELSDGDRQGDVMNFVQGPGPSHIVYEADQFENGSFDIVSVSLEGPLEHHLLSLPTESSRGIGEIRTAEEYAVFRQALEVGSRDLVSSRLDGSSPPVVLTSDPEFSDLGRYRISPTGDVVFRASKTRYHLFSSPIDGSTQPINLLESGLPSTGIESFFILTRDGSRAIFVTRENKAARNLYSVPIDGSALPVKLNGPLVAGGGVRAPQDPLNVSEDGVFVYLADAIVDEQHELWSVPADGSGPAVKLSGSMVSGGDVSPFFGITPDGQRVVYMADALVDGVQELFIAPMDGSSPPVRLNPDLALGGYVGGFQITSDGRSVVYRADGRVDEVFELFLASLDGSSSVEILSGPLTEGGNVWSYQIDPAGIRVVYVADALVDGRFELFSVPLDMSSPPVVLNDPLPHHADVGIYPRITSDSRNVVFIADIENAGQDELYSVRIDGSHRPVKKSGPLPPGGSVHEYKYGPSLDGTRVFYLADQDETGVMELYQAPLVPSSEEPDARTARSRDE